MRFDPELHRRRSIRLLEYDYSSAGAYFVTVCTQGKSCLLGKVSDSAVYLNAYGRLVWDCWNHLPDHYPSIRLDAFVIMPNHIHFIVWITKLLVGAGLPCPDLDAPSPPNRAGEPSPYEAMMKSQLAQVVAYFKYQSTKQINASRRMPGVPFWQRNYYEHIIRSQKSLEAIREYIEMNPVNWLQDNENPDKPPANRHP